MNKLKVAIRYKTSHGEVESVKAVNFFYDDKDVKTCCIEEIEVDNTTYDIIKYARDTRNWVDPETINNRPNG